MATESNNIHTNTFTGGMNSDTSIDIVKNDQYIFGLNIRITTNSLLGGIIDSNGTEGIIAPVPKGITAKYDLADDYLNSNYKVLATASIEDVGAIVISKKYTDGYKWIVYRLDFNADITTDTYTGKVIKFTKLFESECLDSIKDKFSVVINKETSAGNSTSTTDVIKLYISDGVHLIMSINLMDDNYNKKIIDYSGSEYTKTDLITSNRLYPSERLKIIKLISGKLKTSLVLYTYRLYKKYGIYTKLAPLTNKILIIDNNRNKEEGNAEDTSTSLGLTLVVPIKSMFFDNGTSITSSIFDHILIFRISYIKSQEDASVDLIYDSKIKDRDLQINDVGENSLQEYSIDEFSALSELSIIPNNIEQNLNYLFISNITDSTVLRHEISDIDSRTFSLNSQETRSYVLRDNKSPLTSDDVVSTDLPSKDSEYDVNPNSIMNYTITSDFERCNLDSNGYYGGNGNCVSYRFTTTDIIVHQSISTSSLLPPHSGANKPSSSLYYIKYNESNKTFTPEETSINTDYYLSDHGFISSDGLKSASLSLDYDDIICSSMFKSLRRDEVYRYGIIYYDKYGRRSDVLFIGDIRTPKQSECSSYKIKQTSTEKDESYTQDISVTSSSNFYWREKVIAKKRLYLFRITSNQVGDVTIVAKDDGFVKFNLKQLFVGNISELDYILDNKDIVGLNLELYINEEQKYDFGIYNLTQQYLVNSGDKVNLKIYISEVDELMRESTDILRWDNVFNTICASTSGNEDVSTNIKLTATFYPNSESSAYSLISVPLGIQFNVKLPADSDIKYYQIVRCSKLSEYSNILMLCAVSKPVNQYYTLASKNRLWSPYYPSPFLTSQNIRTFAYTNKESYVSNSDNKFLLLLYSPEISLFPEDSLNLIHKNDTYISPVSFNYADELSNIWYALNGFLDNNTFSLSDSLYGVNNDIIHYDRQKFNGSGLTYSDTSSMPVADLVSPSDFKSGQTCNLYYYYKTDELVDTDGNLVAYDSYSIDETSDVQVPTWELGFSNVLLSGSQVLGAVKAYKSYVSTIKTDEYVNWICNGMYNLRVQHTDTQTGLPDDIGDWTHAIKVFTYNVADGSDDDGIDNTIKARWENAAGWIGPGPQCILVRISEDSKNNIFKQSLGHIKGSKGLTLGSVVCNITHTALQFAGFSNQEKQFDIYYGFGNYGTLQDDGEYKVGSTIVFDGDVYTMPCELVSMYKTYNFNSADTLPSAQVVNYIPLETKINTFFDYGINYRNTSTPNLQVEPGEITGVCSQDRPQHQYNAVYSDNNVSNDVYNALSEEESVETYTQRIFYSQLKTNGESIDSWADFRSLNYIDADTRYGKITHMLTNKDVLYFWLTHAFGKLSVNERSLITDNNSNTIQLGQGGVLQRTDYIDTQYGLRENDRSAINTPFGIFWIDVVNKAIISMQNGKLINYSDTLNVQNIVNKYMSTSIPCIEYDQLNSELLCKCLDDDQQLVFNLKFNCATGIYTRKYFDTIKYNNIIYGIGENILDKTNTEEELYNGVLTQYNYIDHTDDADYLSSAKFLSPMKFSFVVNSIPAATKVFDNLLINTLKRKYDSSFVENFLKYKTFTFTTNLNDSGYDRITDSTSTEMLTDREGNICYAIPRIGNKMYGNRLRGRWMRVDVEDSHPEYDYTISNILTKFRQSFN